MIDDNFPFPLYRKEEKTGSNSTEADESTGPITTNSPRRCEAADDNGN